MVAVETRDKFYAEGILQVTVNVTVLFLLSFCVLLGFVPYLVCGYCVLIC